MTSMDILNTLLILLYLLGCYLLGGYCLYLGAKP
jgi:hypothetical protein